MTLWLQVIHYTVYRVKEVNKDTLLWIQRNKILRLYERNIQFHKVHFCSSCDGMVCDPLVLMDFDQSQNSDLSTSFESLFKELLNVHFSLKSVPPNSSCVPSTRSPWQPIALELL